MVRTRRFILHRPAFGQYGAAVDALAGLLRGPRAEGVFVLRSLMSPPWSVYVDDHVALTLIALTHGEAWMVADGETPVPLTAGSIVVVRGPEPYTFADRPDRPPQFLIEEGQRCVSVDGAPLHDSMSLGVRTWGNDPHGATTMLIGAYERVGASADRLMAVLPRLLVLHRDEWSCPLLPVLASEIARDQLGQEGVLDRLVDLVLVSALRDWLTRGDGAPTAWYLAHSDAVVGPALQAMTSDLAHGWTVAELAGMANVSRALFAARFSDLVGTPPLTYLTELRLSTAADRLLAPGATIGAVARDVGYSTPYALSAAFKRVRGVSPKAHRAALGSR
jgi:AraC-like DNA-binding protein